MSKELFSRCLAVHIWTASGERDEPHKAGRWVSFFVALIPPVILLIVLALA